MTQVSVVIPTRGRPASVTNAVASAVTQTHADLEIVVVVDGPDPVTEAALAADADPRLRVVVNPTSLGGSEARNVGVRAATGDWVAFLDDDDEWHPSKLERQLAAMSASGHPQAIGSCAIVVRTPDGDRAWRTRPPRDDEPLSEYLFVRSSLRRGEGTVGTSTIVVGRALAVAVPFDPSLRRYQDADWLLRAIAAGGHLVFVDERLSVWTVRSDGASVTAAHSTDWRGAFDWIVARRQLVTGRAYAAFLLVRVAALAAAAGDRSAIRPIWHEARRSGQPAVTDVVLFAARWIMPSGVRTRLRRRLAGVHLPPGRA